MFNKNITSLLVNGKSNRSGMSSMNPIDAGSLMYTQCNEAVDLSATAAPSTMHESYCYCYRQL